MLQSIRDYFSPQKQQEPSNIRLPKHYPHILHYYNDKLAQIEQLNRISRSLGVAPILVVSFAVTILSLLLFGPYIANAVIISMIITSLSLKSLRLNQQMNASNEQYFITMISLIAFSIYMLVYNWIDFILDWIPGYYIVKLCLVTALIGQVESEADQDDGQNDDGFRLDSLPHPYPIVTQVIQTARISFQLLYAYTIYYTRSTLWTIRTKAFEWAKLYESVEPVIKPDSNHQHCHSSDELQQVEQPTLALSDSEIYEMITHDDFLESSTGSETTGVNLALESPTDNITPASPSAPQFPFDDEDGIAAPTLDDILATPSSPLEEDVDENPTYEEHHEDDTTDKHLDLPCPTYGSLYSNQSLNESVQDNYYQSDDLSPRNNHDILVPSAPLEPLLAHETELLSREQGKSEDWCVVDDTSSNSN